MNLFARYHNGLNVTTVAQLKRYDVFTFVGDNKQFKVKRCYMSNIEGSVYKRCRNMYHIKLYNNPPMCLHSSQRISII